MTNIRVRIAPSPTGYPHIGTVFQALLNFIYARKHQGSFIVRIEDTDRTRFVADAEEAIFDALNWFDLNPDESPRHESKFGPYRQSERLPVYQKYASQLIDAGHAYRCFCSKDRLESVRKKMQADGLPPMYDRHCRSLDENESAKRAETEEHVVRMKIPDHQKIVCVDEIRGPIEFDSNVVDDQVIIKSDGFPTYHLAVVVDDHLMEITHMVRGEEWISSSPKHVLLYDYFGWEKPKFIHTPALRNPDKSKLSKRHGHASFSWYKENGYLKEAILNFLITRVWNHPQGKEIFPIEDMIQYFDFKQMHIQGPIVDLQKLDWINSQWIRQKSDQELFDLLRPFAAQELTDHMLISFIPHVKERLKKLSEIRELSEYLYQDPELSNILPIMLKEAKTDAANLKSYFEKALTAIQQVPEVTAHDLEKSLRQLQQDAGWKPRAAFMSLRLALTGKEHTPPLFDIMVLLGLPTVEKRLSNAINSLT